jgi:hypothetical protein
MAEFEGLSIESTERALFVAGMRPGRAVSDDGHLARFDGRVGSPDGAEAEVTICLSLEAAHEVGRTLAKTARSWREAEIEAEREGGEDRG